MPLEELQGVRDAVRQIEHLAKLKNRLLASARARTMEEARTELVGGAAQHFDLTLEPVDVTKPLRTRVKQGMRYAVAAHTKMEFLFRHLDGHQPNGPFWSYFFKPMADAENAENTMRRDIATSLKGIMAAYTKQERHAWFTEAVDIPEAATAKIAGRFTKSNLLAVALNWGNEYNRAALMEGYGWSEPQVLRILAQLDDRDWRTVQAIWDYLDTFWPAARDLEREVTGLSPDKVERAPFAAPNGLPIEGGYYPVAFDREQSSRQVSQDEASSVRDMLGGFPGRAMTRHGHLEERQNTGGKPLLLELGVIAEHLTSVAHDLAFRRPVIDVVKLMNDAEIRRAIEGAAGREMYQQLEPWVRNIASDRSRDPVHFVEKLASRARAGVSTVALGFNVVSSVLQTLGFGPSVKEIGVTYAMRGVKDVYGSPLQIKAAHGFIVERSAMMRDRIASFDRDVRDLTRRPDALGIPGVDPSAFFAFIAYMDMGVSLPSWMGAYQKAMDGTQAGIESGDEAAAIDYADSVVRMTQAAGGAKDLAAVQRGNEAVRLFTAFYSSMAVQFNQFASATQEFGRSGDVGKLIAAAALLWFVPAILEDLIRGRGPDDDEDWIAWSARKLITYPMSSVIGLREIASGIEMGRGDVGDTALTTVYNSVLKTGTALHDLVTGDEVSRADLREAFNTVGYLAKLPTRQVWKTLEFWYDWMTGEVEPTGPFDFLWKTAAGSPRR